MSMKKSHDTIGNRTRDLPACSAVPQPTAPPRTPKERRGYSHLKEEALDRTMWRACFGRGFGPVVRQTTKRMNLLGAQKKNFTRSRTPLSATLLFWKGRCIFQTPKNKYILKLVRPTHHVLRFTSHRYAASFFLAPSVVLIDVFYMGSVC